MDRHAPVERRRHRRGVTGTHEQEHRLMKIDRRRALGLLGAGAAAPAVAQAAETGAPGATAAFAWGVASGDPLQDRVLLWTRFAALDGERSPARVRWEVAKDEGFQHIVTKGEGAVGPQRDFTLKVEAAGLQPGRDYFYRFFGRAGGGAWRASPVGRARTLPVGPVKDVVLAFATCSLICNGYFNAYEAIARLPRVDAVIHLGDYIYEYGGPGSYGMDSAVAHERAPQPPHDCITLEDYRTRLAQYRRDPQLQAAHARAPWIVVWDDHETANDSWVGGAENHRPDEGDWNLRKAAAIKAYYEWMPIREPKDHGFDIWRSFDFGDVASLFMLETRLTARDHQVTYAELFPDPTPAAVAAFRAKLDDPSRKMMSAGQEAWLAEGMERSVRSGRPWQVLGNQVVMARIIPPPVRRMVGDAKLNAALEGKSGEVKRAVLTADRVGELGLPYLTDSWDGYAADRQRLYAIFEKAHANCIVVSGDSHAFWVNELYDSPDGGRLAAVEFGTTAITSPGAGDELPGFPVGELFMKANRDVLFNDASAKGFVLLTLTRETAVGELIAVSTITSKTYSTKVLTRFSATPGPDGVSRLTPA
jgi:alkaline phosphatase D